MSRVVVVGLGYVGLPLAVRAAEIGHAVIGIDLDAEKADAVNACASYIEDVSDESLRAAVGQGRLRAFTSWSLPESTTEALHSFDVGVITVPTPVRDGTPDLSHVESAARMLGHWVSPGAVVVLESTTYPGTTEGLVADAIFEESGLKPGHDYHLGFSPERIDPGNPIHTFETTPKIVSGTDDKALEKVQAFYDGLVHQTVPVSSPKVAELTKLFENIFSQVNIALVNEMAIIAHELGVDVWEMIDAAATKPHGFMKHTPGPGVGGHCIPVDPTYLTWLTREELGLPFRLSELAQQINDSMPAYVVSRARQRLGEHGLEGAKVLIAGVAYKSGTDDIRQSPALEIIRLLRDSGASVTVTDPHVRRWEETPILELESVLPSIGDFTLVILVTDHDEFDYDKLAKAAPLVLDCRHRMPASPHVECL
ncbi:MAG: nucleotide sugar dehydrogenase [Nocardioides sp.]